MPDTPPEQNAAAAPALPVAVVVPVLDRAEQLRRALASVAAQAPARAAEVIVVDDGSSDGSAEVALAAGARVLRRTARGGPNRARNDALAATKQPWVAFLDSDDEWLPGHLDALWRARGRHHLVCASHLQVGHDGQVAFAGVLRRRPIVLTSPDRAIFPGNLFATSATMARRDALLRAGGFPVLRRAGDLALWSRVLAGGSAVVLPQPTVIYHGHAGQLTADLEPTFAAVLAIAEEANGDGAVSATTLELARGRVAWDRAIAAARGGRRGAAAGAVLRLAVRPRRACGAAVTLARRGALRRRSTSWTPAGTPTVALLDGRPPHAAAAPGAVLDLRSTPRARALARLALRPTAQAVASGPATRLVLRGLGIEAQNIA